jgi:hypothetical protein
MSPRRCGIGLPCHPSDGRDQFLNLVPLIRHITGRESSRDTMRHVITEDLLLDFMEGGADGIDLSQDIHAITVVFYHPKQTTNLALDAPEPPGDLRFRDIVHGDLSLIPYL